MFNLNFYDVSIIKVTKIYTNEIGRIKIKLGNGVFLETVLFLPFDYGFLPIPTTQEYASVRNGLKSLLESQKRIFLVTKDNLHEIVSNVLLGKLPPFDYIIADIKLDDGRTLTDMYRKSKHMVSRKRIEDLHEKGLLNWSI